MYKRKDFHYRRAKEAGYRSRAAYKLLELARRYRLIQPGDRVLDLGAWPGSWSQVAMELAGSGGRVIGVDLQPMDPLGGVCELICGDVAEPSVQEDIVRRLGGAADVLLSDMAPKLTGIRFRDQARTTELAELALQCARRMLRAGGRLLMKMFMQPDTEEIVAQLRRDFHAVHLTRAEATRKGSSEVYVIALGFRAAPTAVRA